MITEQGIHPDMDEATYHGDPCPSPALSSGIIRTIVESTLAHARLQHPRLVATTDHSSDAADTGTLMHALVMGRDAGIKIIDAPDWRTKAAKDERDAARAEGKTALLKHQYAALLPAVVPLQAYMRGLPGNPLGADYGHEVSMIWREGEVWCKARPDFFPCNASPRAIIYDLKTSAMTAEPDRAMKRMIDRGYDIQAEWYCRGYELLTGVRPRFVFVAAETEPPFACSAIEFTQASLSLASRKIDYAIREWGEALHSNYWPAYPTRIIRMDIPPWHESRWIEREQRELDAVEDAPRKPLFITDYLEA